MIATDHETTVRTSGGERASGLGGRVPAEDRRAGEHGHDGSHRQEGPKGDVVLAPPAPEDHEGDTDDRPQQEAEEHAEEHVAQVEPAQEQTEEERQAERLRVAKIGLRAQEVEREKGGVIDITNDP